EELLRLRSEVGKLREERQQLSKQIQSAQSESQRTQDQMTRMRTNLQQVQNENQTRAGLGGQTPQTAQMNTCINQLRQLDGAKQQWALEHQRTPDTIPNPQDIAPYLNNNLPTCPAGGTYTLNAVNQQPTC